jgi:hypothetical protein
MEFCFTRSAPLAQIIGNPPFHVYTKAPLFIICCARIQHKPSAFILQKKVVEHFRAKGSYPGHRLFALNRNI